MKRHLHAFTLVELAIVLVIIGLIVGGVLVGQSLIETATIRSAIRQIEQYDAAANTFRNKYNGLPGDLKNAASFGFVARGAVAGTGDGDGVLNGLYNNGQPRGGVVARGETATFWRDLSDAKLIGESFTTADNTTLPGANLTTDAGIAALIPKSKLANGIYLYAFSTDQMTTSTGLPSKTNYWALSGVSSINTNGILAASRSLRVMAAYNIDVKMDDGLPMSGIVSAIYLFGDGGIYWVGATSTAATGGSTSTCYDNNSVASATQIYSTRFNDGVSANCALTIRPSF